MLTMFTKISSEYLLLIKARILTNIWANQSMWENNELLQSIGAIPQSMWENNELLQSTVYEQVSYYQSDNHELQ